MQSFSCEHLLHSHIDSDLCCIIYTYWERVLRNKLCLTIRHFKYKSPNNCSLWAQGHRIYPEYWFQEAIINSHQIWIFELIWRTNIISPLICCTFSISKIRKPSAALVKNGCWHYRVWQQITSSPLFGYGNFYCNSMSAQNWWDCKTPTRKSKFTEARWEEAM